MRLLLISNSTNAGGAYLEHCLGEIRSFLGSRPLNALFVPYAGITLGFDDYTEKVRAIFRDIGHDITSIHETRNPSETVEKAEAIVTGGGNTFHLVRMLHKSGLMGGIRRKVLAGTPFIGWSAGSNIACPTLCTTNDMPVVEPFSFETLNLVPFQINPHYLDAGPGGHAGESREMRIEEYIEINPDVWVVGLREGTMFRLEGNNIQLIGSKTARIFRKGREPVEMGPDTDFSFLL